MMSQTQESFDTALFVRALRSGIIGATTEVRRGRARPKLSSAEGHVFPEARNGSVGEIQYNGEPLLRGTFRPD